MMRFQIKLYSAHEQVLHTKLEQHRSYEQKQYHAGKECELQKCIFIYCNNSTELYLLGPLAYLCSSEATARSFPPVLVEMNKALSFSQYLIFLLCQVEQTRENTLPAVCAVQLLWGSCIRLSFLFSLLSYTLYSIHEHAACSCELTMNPCTLQLITTGFLSLTTLRFRDFRLARWPQD